MQQTFIVQRRHLWAGFHEPFICILISSHGQSLLLSWWMIKETMEETLPLLNNNTEIKFVGSIITLVYDN